MHGKEINKTDRSPFHSLCKKEKFDKWRNRDVD